MNEKLKELAEQAANEIAALFKHGFFDQRMVDYLTKIIQTKIDRAKTEEREQCAKDYLEDCARAIEKAEEEERRECAKQYLEITRDAVKKAILKEREACAKACQAIGKHELITMCAKAIRGRTE